MPLYKLYNQVLVLATAGNLHDLQFICLILTVICVTYQNCPLSAEAIGSFITGHSCYIGRNIMQIHNAVMNLHAALYKDHQTGAIRAYHVSFYDFLASQYSDTAEISLEWPSLSSVQQHMLCRCLDIMHTRLRFNVCNLNKPDFNKNIANLPEQISIHIEEDTQYSTIFWYTHLLATSRASANVYDKILKLFNSKKFLFWLEYLSLQASLPHSLLALETCQRIFTVSINYHYYM